MRQKQRNAQKNYKPKSGVGASTQTPHTSPFIDKYTAFLENHGRHFDNLVETKTREYFKIEAARRTMPPIDDIELQETTDTYIRLHRMSELTGNFIYPTPSTFFQHYFDIINSKEFKKNAEDFDVERSLSDLQTREQIEFLLDQLTLTWGTKFPPDTRIRLLARSFANFDRFCKTDEFLKLPESIQLQFSRYQTVRNFYRQIEQTPQVTDIRKSPVMTIPYLRSLIKRRNKLQD